METDGHFNVMSFDMAYNFSVISFEMEVTRCFTENRTGKEMKKKA